jgi:phenylacetate-CoA ligase
MSVGLEVYKRLPVWAQHGAVSVYGAYWHWLRFGPGYAGHVRGYEQRESLRPEQWIDWQHRRLIELLTSAAQNIPYYRNSWNASAIRAAQAGEIRDLPLLEKEPIRAHPEAFLRDDIMPRPTFAFHTSGSTGTPIRTIWTLSEIRNSMALREVRSNRIAGVSFRMPRATFSGRMSEPDPESKGPFYRFNAVERQVYFSPFHLRPDTAHRYVDALRKHNIQWMTGYAVSYYLLARLILEQGIEAPKIQAVITTSEKLTHEMRRVIEAAFHTRVYEEYSTVESSLFAGECRAGRLHVSPDVGVVEILRSDGSACQPGEAGEVVATSFVRNYQIFVRYRLGDTAAWDEDRCTCGSSMPVLKEVLGRTEDVVIGPDGRQMVRFHGIFVDQPHVREGQIIQEELDLITVKIVAAAGFDETDVQDVIHRVQNRLGPSVRVNVEQVESIPRTARGKFQAVVSRLKDKRVPLETEANA